MTIFDASENIARQAQVSVIVPPESAAGHVICIEVAIKKLTFAIHFSVYFL